MRSIVFISYATVDSENYKISSIADKLTKYEDIIEVLYWEEHMYDDILKYMNDNLGRCNVLVLFCSANALQSESVEIEWMSALKLKKKIIPVFQSESDIPPLLTTKLGVMFDFENIDQTVKKIYELVLKKQKAVTDKEAVSPNVKTEKNSLEKTTKIIAQAIFGGEKVAKIAGKEYNIKKYKNGVCYVHTENYRFLQQNPEKSSRYGELARRGKKIVWVISNKKGKNKNYHAFLLDDDFIYL